MNRYAVVLLSLVFAATGVGIGGCGYSIPSSGSPSSSNPRDGIYDFSYVWNDNGTLRTEVVPQYFRVTNGNISSSPSGLSGVVLDDFGNVEFTGPCPVNGNAAQFTGILNLINPLGGHGDWQCDIGGVSNTWRAYNGQPW